MRRFVLERNEDVSGVSGTGVVVEGVEFTDGTVVIRWLGDLKSTSMYPDVDILMQVHGHDERTQLCWVDD